MQGTKSSDRKQCLRYVFLTIPKVRFRVFDCFSQSGVAVPCNKYFKSRNLKCGIGKDKTCLSFFLGGFMKKNSKRQIRNYDKYDYYNKEYYGILVKKDRTRIDVKRMMNTCDLDENIYEFMNKPRKTVYFMPDRIKRHDYMINIFRDTINSQKAIWTNEMIPVIRKIETPSEVANNARTGYFMQTGIMEHDELQIYAGIESNKREYHYNQVIYLLVVQFVHQYVSSIEAVTLKVISRNGYQNERFSRNELDAFVQGKANIKLSNIEHYDKYDRLYIVWHFLKHNSIDLYNKIQKYPEILVKNHKFENGDMAMDVLKINLDFVDNMFFDLIRFFEKLCEKVFNEDIETSKWNYDGYFREHVNDLIEEYNNPLGLPDF